MIPADRFAVDTVDERISCLQIATDQDRHMGPLWVDGFTRALERLSENDQLRAVVLVGGERVFSLGASKPASQRTPRAPRMPCSTCPCRWSPPSRATPSGEVC
jgi:enoyl-CoA hydratase/carnithine racemase